ncbi:unnamed protein product [Nyctereutes procyonoides]|uniref:(raccoon dog) hypothetical protein n=1 Tax=Nyctereutes procyonoides TaxID=34880 RepID=A0A811ZZ75_NYCPR|nr:unnamed protein product [Nyctereutes procyonoides]
MVLQYDDFGAEMVSAEGFQALGVARAQAMGAEVPCGPLTPEFMAPHPEHTVGEQKAGLMELCRGLKAQVTLSSGAMWRPLAMLQTGHPLRSGIADILACTRKPGFTTAYRNVTEFKTLRGLVLRGSLTERHLFVHRKELFVHRVDFPPSLRAHLLTKKEKIQLRALLAIFQVTRDLTVTEA